MPKSARSGSIGNTNSNQPKIRGCGRETRGVFAMKKLLLIGAVLSVFSFVVATMSFGDDMSMSKAQTVHGWVSDSKCGAKGANAKAAECTKKCLSEGAKMVVVTDGDQKVLTVENPDALQDHVRHHVAVAGHIDGDTIHVESAKML
jgi:hypothetical protein